jgi:hypothetical protein
MEIEILNVAFKDFFRVKVPPQRRTGVFVELNERAVLEPENSSSDFILIYQAWPDGF